VTYRPIKSESGMKLVWLLRIKAGLSSSDDAGPSSSKIWTKPSALVK